MRKIRLIMLLTSVFVSLNSYAEDKISFDVYCKSPGSLSTLIPEDRLSYLEQLSVTGSINSEDLIFINRIINTGHLKVINLGESEYSDYYTTFNFSLPEYSEDGNSIIGYGKVDKIVMPHSEYFYLSLGASSYVDTICINSKHVLRAYGNTSNYSIPASYAIKKIILNEGVESIGNSAFVKDDSEPRRSAFIVDEFPSTLKKIERMAFYSYKGHVDGEPSEPGYLINPMAVLTEGIEIVGEPNISSDYNGNVKNSWTSEKMFIKNSVVKLPSSLKSLNGYLYNAGIHLSTWEYYPTEILCDTLVIPKQVEFLAIKATAKVIVSYTDKPVLWTTGGTFKADTLYVPKDALYTYLKQAETYQIIDIKEILPIEEVTSISLKPILSTIKVGQSTQVRAEIIPKEAFDKNLVYWVADSAIAKIDKNGVITGFNAGQTLVYAQSANGVIDSCSIIVEQPVEGINIKPTQVNLKLGQSVELLAEVFPGNASNKRVKWSSTNPQICYVNNSGKVTALTTGLAIISATTEDGEYSAECLALSNYVVDTKIVQPTLEVGSSLSLLITDKQAVETNVRWQSSNPEVAAVDEQGKVWFNSAGSVVITAECDGNEYSIPFDVKEVVARALNVFPVEAVGGIGYEFSLLALHEPENTTDKSVTWESSDPEVATVSEDGRVSLASLGTAQITARSGEHTAVCAVTADNTVGLTEMASTGVVIDIIDGGIIVRNVPIGESIAIYSVDGKAINGAVVASEETKLNLAAGIYIVKISPSTVAKVLIK